MDAGGSINANITDKSAVKPTWETCAHVWDLSQMATQLN